MRWINDNPILFFLFDSFPNTAAVLAGAMVITHYLPRRPHYWLRVIASYLLIGFWIFCGKQEFPDIALDRIVFSIPAFSGLYLFTAFSVMIWNEASWLQAFFAATVSYALQNACERLIEIPLIYFDWFPRQVIIPVFAVVLYLLYRLIRQYQKKKAVFDFSNTDSRMMLCISTGAMVVCIWLDLVLKRATINVDADLRAWICVTMMLFSLLIVLLSFCHVQQTDAQKRSEEIAQLLRAEQRRFDNEKQIHDAINIKCHDIRHQIAAIRSTSTDDAYRAELKKIGKLVDIYDTTPHSQNAALDVVLASKMLTCSSRNIIITCMADGRRLGFMEDCDVYALFGNILDNAIEAVSRVPNSEQRMITLTVESKGDFMVIECENFFVGDLTFDDGLPLTTKADQMNHGFGTHSIRALAEKYNGCLKISVMEDIFTLSILLPIPA